MSDVTVPQLDAPVFITCAESPREDPAPRSRYGAGPREVFRGRAPGSTLGQVVSATVLPLPEMSRHPCRPTSRPCTGANPYAC